MNLYTGEIITEYFEIRKLTRYTKEELLKEVWEKYRGSEVPVLLISPFLDQGEWRKLQLTNIYMSVDTKGVDLLKELRLILAPKPNILERIIQRVKKNLFNKKIDLWWLEIPKVKTYNLSF